MDARAFAILKHGDQKYGNIPYVVHLDKVVQNLVEFGAEDDKYVNAGYLHDVVEDTECTVGEVALYFGQHVSNMVYAVTSESGKNRKERNLKTYPKIRNFPDAKIVKLADRLANVEHSLATKSPLLEMYRKEHTMFREHLYVPSDSRIIQEMWGWLDGWLLYRN
jgi:(p)ppGpp synthase/HD superfamily hydrolase